MAGKPRRWWPFKSNPCSNVIQIRHFLPCPNAQQQCNKLRLTGHLPAPPATTPKPSNISSKYAQMAPNLLSQNSRKVSQNALHTQPEAASLPSCSIPTTTTLPRMATKPSRPLRSLAKHTRRGSKRCEFLHAFDIRHCWIILTTISRLEMRKQRIGAVESKALEGERRWDWNRCRCHDTPRSPHLPPSGRVHLLPDPFSPDHRYPSTRWSRRTVCPSSFPFTHRTQDS